MRVSRSPWSSFRTDVKARQEDQGDLDTLIKNFKAGFNQNMEHRRRWGGGIMGVKSNHIMAKREKAIQIEAAKKMGLGM